MSDVDYFSFVTLIKILSAGPDVAPDALTVLSPMAAASSRILKKGMTLTQVYLFIIYFIYLVYHSLKGILSIQTTQFSIRLNELSSTVPLFVNKLSSVKWKPALYCVILLSA